LAPSNWDDYSGKGLVPLRLGVRIVATCSVVIHVVVRRITSEVAPVVAIALLAVAVICRPLGVGGRTIELTVVPGVAIPGVVVPAAPAPALAFMATGVDVAHWDRLVSLFPSGVTRLDSRARIIGTYC
jgi:hypothetical protein